MMMMVNRHNVDMENYLKYQPNTCTFIHFEIDNKKKKLFNKFVRKKITNPKIMEVCCCLEKL